MASKIVSKILEGATDLFAKQGYHGATIRELALRADVAEPSIYRLFLNKEQLFHQCLTGIVEQSLDPMQFEQLIDTRSGEKFTQLIISAIRRWYFSLSAQSARLLMQAALSGNKEWAELAYSRIERIVAILGAAVENENATIKGKGLAAARLLIFALFQFKIARPMLPSSEKEREAVDSAIDVWLLCIQ